MRTETWVIEPRDPLVVRDGRSTAEIGAGAPFPFPLPNTIAGMARASFVGRRSHVGAEEARRLLSVRIKRGPFLVERSSDTITHWLPAPSDAVVGRFDVHPHGNRIAAIARGSVIGLGEDEGVIWPDGTPGGLGMVELPGRDHDERKTKPLIEKTPFWSLDNAITWAIGRGPYVVFSDLPTPLTGERTALIREENRIHVVIDSQSQTAEPGMLYGTPGIRFAEGFGIAIEIEAPEDLAWPSDDRFVQLGGEARPSFRRVDEEARFPLFDDFKEKYHNAATKHPAGLRLELLTPAWLHDGVGVGDAAWLPSWTASGYHPLLPGVRLELAAVCLPGFTAISGWNLQGGKERAGAPRAVRRLVPAGSVYYFRARDGAGNAIEDAGTLADAAGALWAAPIEPEGDARERDDFLAPAACDGFGLVLPGFWWEGEGSPRSGGER